MELAFGGDAFDRLNVLADGVDGEHGAAVDDFAIDADGAGAAGAAVTDAFGAGEVHAVAESVEQSGARFDFDGTLFAVDIERDLDFTGHYFRGGLGIGFGRENTHANGTCADAAEPRAA